MKLRRALVVLSLLAISAVAAAWATCAAQAWQVRATGASLYNGELPLAARIAGHEATLPPTATRCSNCHGSAQPLGPALTAASLGQSAPRRGGPPSKYDLRAFCTLLRTGIDPAYVQINRAMPRYEIDERACGALWAHLQSR